MKTIRVLFLILVPCFLFAQGSSTGGAFLKLPLNARLSALGEALVADGGHLSSVNTNPANLYRLSTIELEASHSQFIQDIQSQQLGLAVPFSSGTIGLQLATTSVPGIEIREVPGEPISVVSAKNAIFQLGFSRPITDEIILGIGAKYLYEKIYVDEHTGFALDAGLLYQTGWEGIVVGASVNNVGSMKAMRSSADDLPQHVSLGATYEFPVVRDITCRSFLAYSFLKGPNANRALVGAEFQYAGYLALRAGYQTGIDSRNVSFGLGFMYGAASLDYALLPYSNDLGNSNQITLGLHF